MDSKKRKRFVFESDTESAATCHACCRKRFRWTLSEDEEYDGNDDKAIYQRNLMHSKQCEDLEPGEREAPIQKPKFELTANQREKGAALAYPDPSGPQMLTTEWEDPVHLYVGLRTTGVGGGGLGPRLLDLNREPDQDDLSVPTEKGPLPAYSDTWGLPTTNVEYDLAPLCEGLLTPQVQKRKLLDLNREPDEDDL